MANPTLFLDESSRFPHAVTKQDAERAAISLIKALRSIKKISKNISLNTAHSIAQHHVAENWTLQAVLGGPSFKEEWGFIRGLVDRSPFSTGFDDFQNDINAMDFRTKENSVTSIALAWAYLLNTATVSFDAHPDWTHAWVETQFESLDDNGTLTSNEAR